MNAGHGPGEPLAADPAGQTTSTADLHDAIARHLDGGLDPDAQRALARRLAESPEARRLLASHLRIEAALVRLGLGGQLRVAAGQASVAAGQAAAGSRASAAAVSPAPPQPAPATGRRRARRSVAAELALAAAAVVALALLPWRLAEQGRVAEQAGGDMDRVAAEWLLVSSAPNAFDPDATAVVADDGPDDADADSSDESAAGPPAWLVAAMADEELQRRSPDAG